ncbi:Spore germination protein gerPA/gerPF [Desulfofundulus australicus DSM 11792]|uniref:Spore germination protein gerPA/gerPF n=1 Tax=Desulfofundulus australicus DSM 11792 TaxID=1121425 RepID=A0A1M5CMX0_9FIRM|nr:Spore germination protein gerPA/gerPF [Desulfofundulus australicus DSM 11792]
MVTIIIGTIKVNSIQSGGTLIVGERVVCLPTSEMSVQAGPGSLNSGDGNIYGTPPPGKPPGERVPGPQTDPGRVGHAFNHRHL